jgi:drug/metabolite transporter (DMT)-like permease
MIFSAVMASISQMLLKKSTKKSYSCVFFEYLNPYVIGGYLILILTMFMNIIGYKGVEYKVGSILATSSYIFVMIVGKIFFNEPITYRKIIGMFFIISGIIIYNI